MKKAEQKCEICQSLKSKKSLWSFLKYPEIKMGSEITSEFCVDCHLAIMEYIKYLKREARK